MKLQLTMSLEQASYVRNALEAYARVGMGQWDLLLESLKPELGFQDKKGIENIINLALLLPDNKGIRDIDTESHKVAWEVYQHMRRELAWHNKGLDWRTDQRKWPEMMQVMYDDPMKISSLGGKIESRITKPCNCTHIDIKDMRKDWIYCPWCGYKLKEIE